MDGENNGKPYWIGWFGGTIIFGNTHIQNQSMQIQSWFQDLCNTLLELGAKTKQLV